MQVRLITRYAGPAGCWQPGDVREVAAEEAEVLVAGGYAVALHPAPVSVTTGDQFDDLTVVKGIGPKMAGLLAGAGVRTFQALADVDPAQLAEAINVNVRRVRRWQADVMGFLG